MAKNVYDTYLEGEVLGANPVKLITILFRAAVESVTAARIHLKRGEILERSRQITKAFHIIHELDRSLDHSAGGEISKNLSRLYCYMETRLLEANAKQIEPPLAEVQGLLTTLAEAWTSVAQSGAVGHVQGRAAANHTPEVSTGMYPAQDAAPADYVPLCATY